MKPLHYVSVLVLVFFVSACGRRLEPTEVSSNTSPSASPSETEVVVESTTEVEATAVVLELSFQTVSIAGIPVIEDSFSNRSQSGRSSIGQGIYASECAECHAVDSQDAIAGASGLLGIPQRAVYYANGETSPQAYIYTAIANPSYHPDLSLSDGQANDIVAYLMNSANIEGESVAIYEVPESSTSTDTATANSGESSIAGLITNADAANGELLFATNPVTPCSACHLVDSEVMLVGPGLLNVGSRAANRVSGQSVEDYLYNSIVHPNDFIVDGFTPVMPANYGDMLSDDDIYDIIAYLLSLD